VLGAFRARRRAKKATRSTTRRRLTRGGIGVVLALVVVIAGSGIFLDIELHKIHHIAVNNLKTVATSGSAAGADDILLVGSTDRCAVQSSKYLKNFNTNASRA